MPDVHAFSKSARARNAAKVSSASSRSCPFLIACCLFALFYSQAGALEVKSLQQMAQVVAFEEAQRKIDDLEQKLEEVCVCVWARPSARDLSSLKITFSCTIFGAFTVAVSAPSTSRSPCAQRCGWYRLVACAKTFPHAETPVNQEPKRPSTGAPLTRTPTNTAPTHTHPPAGFQDAPDGGEAAGGHGGRAD